VIWRFRGSPHYLRAQGDRLGVSRVLTDQAAKNPEIHRVAVLAGQLCERYHQAPKVDGVARIGGPATAQVEGTLGQCEMECAKLHALAAAAAAIVDEARAAFGLAPRERSYDVQCKFDTTKTKTDGPAA
jgi:hypothetical protein